MVTCLNSSQFFMQFTITCGTLNDTAAHTPHLQILMQWENLSSVAGYLIIPIFSLTFNSMLFLNEKCLP